MSKNSSTQNLDSPEDDDSENEGVPTTTDRQAPSGETHHLLSWIWTSIPTPVAHGEEGMDDLLRVEWLKSYARVA
ncbi:hypothetical protein HYDPIDRAFT_29053 [Hydnomerulius pinastri MD-312]|uniref:Uncharacterized protein n=1 Tax=Hydnomerulius pinastri MD-312 TaxID=994086 RepID=A0A0C9W8E1_9AGAM|nr:hypothetical protein HYDPIDRAFT_29053 [Hydnomerulius pinastri MD-312]